MCVFVYFFTGGCECFLSRALLSGSHYVLSLCHCVTLLCYSPDVEQIKMMMMMITPCNVAGSWHWFRQVTALCNVACKGKGLDTCYSATYMSQTRDQLRFTISELAADWHEPMVRSALCGYPFPALTDNWTHGAASSRHTIASIILGLHTVAVATTDFSFRWG